MDYMSCMSCVSMQIVFVKRDKKDNWVMKVMRAALVE